MLPPSGCSAAANRSPSRRSCAARCTTPARPTGRRIRRPRPSRPTAGPHPALPELFDDIERRTFDFFWANGNPANGMVPDRYPSNSPASIAAIGMALTAYVIGVDRGFVTREQARARTLATVRFFRNAPQGTQRVGVTGYKGFFYHFLDMKTGHRAGRSELSTVDTALLIGGMLHAQAYFDSDHPDEAEIRAQVDAIYWRVDWKWAQVRGDFVSMGWKPESGFIPHDWQGYNEAMLVVLLALGSPTHPVGDGRLDRLDEQLQGRLGPLHGLRAPELRPALRPSVLAHVDRFPRHPGRDHARARHRLFREHAAAPPTRSAPTPSPTRRAGTSTGRTSGASPRATGPARCTSPTAWGARATFSTTRRAAPAAGPPSTTGRSRRPPPSRACPSRPRSPSRRPRKCTRATASTSIPGTASSIRSTAASPRPMSPSPTAGSTLRSAGSRRTISASIRVPSSRMICNYRNQLVWDDMRNCAPLRRGLARAGFTGGWLDQDA